jgi:hypothetical protein
MSCPSRHDLEQLLAEQLDDRQRETLAAHVEGCACCQEALGALSDDSEEPWPP